MRRVVGFNGFVSHSGGGDSGHTATQPSRQQQCPHGRNEADCSDCHALGVFSAAVHADQERIRVNRSEGPCVCGDCGSPGFPGMNNMCSMCYGSHCKWRPDGQPFHRTKKGENGSSYTIPYDMCDDYPGMREHLMLASMCGPSPSGGYDDVDIVDQLTMADRADVDIVDQLIMADRADVDIVDQLVMEEGFGSDYRNVMGKLAMTRAEAEQMWEGVQIKRDGKKALLKLLRLGWKGSGCCPEGYDRAHYFDVELAAEAIIRMPGPKPSLNYLGDVAEALRSSGNWPFITFEKYERGELGVSDMQ